MELVIEFHDKNRMFAALFELKLSGPFPDGSETFMVINGLLFSNNVRPQV